METDATLKDLFTTDGHSTYFMIKAINQELKTQKPIDVITQNI